MSINEDKILRVDLSKMKVLTEPVKKELVKNFIGGRGLGAKILYDEVKPKTDPFDPANRLIFAVGPLTGTTAISTNRLAVVTKSPLTGIYLVSLVGGFIAAELRFAGYMAVIVSGRAEKPVYLWINNDKVEIKKADHLWGMPTNETQIFLREELGDKVQIACIGPAGEKMVKYACIVHGKRTAGRGGAGAVMVSKNLKAVAVRGTKRKVRIADEEKFREAAKELLEDSRVMKDWAICGTPTSVGPVNTSMGIFPTRNYQESMFEGVENILGETMKKKIVVKDVTCFRCPITCTKISIIRDGPYAGTVARGPEYETLWSLGANCGNSNLESIATASMLCDNLGMDTISVGSVISFAMECYEKGIISKEDMGGVEPRFGNYEAIIEMIRKIAFREGFGAILAEGVRRAAEKIGKNSEKYAMHVKGLELPGYDPRGLKAMGINYATASRGGCHCRGYPTQELFGIPEKVNRFEIAGKGRIAAWNQDVTAIIDSSTICLFTAQFVFLQKLDKLDIIARLLAATTGIEEFEDVAEILRIGERINNLERAFNVREGMTRRDDSLPERLLKEPIPKGPSQGHVFELEPILEEYYEVRGWDKSSGIPLKSKLEELGLKEVADELETLKPS